MKYINIFNLKNKNKRNILTSKKQRLTFLNEINNLKKKNLGLNVIKICFKNYKFKYE